MFLDDVRETVSVPCLVIGCSSCSNFFPECLKAFGKEEDKNEHKDNQCARRHVEVVGESKSGNTAEEAEKNGESYDFGIVCHKKVGGHLRHREQRHKQNNAYQTDAEHNGNSNEKHHDILYKTSRQSAGTRKFSIKGDRDDGMVEKQEEQQQKPCQDKEGQQITVRNGENVSEKVLR